uniref:Uncharacterized protein n=1 Tax=Ananas comosus var. bracteatus TaxID=296719 RepID=A0A6V7PVW5_ANACO|nr:unnamed protein product [Ananas comosus var. bracteatus]
MLRARFSHGDKGKSVGNEPSETGMISGTQGTTLSDTTGHTGRSMQDDRHQDEAIIREDTVRDLFLLDNQIPFFVIEEIHKLASKAREARRQSSSNEPSNVAPSNAIPRSRSRVQSKGLFDSPFSFGRDVQQWDNEIPHLSIDGKTESIFSNLILFEKGCSHTGRYINAYVAFMSQLLSDADDVKLLARENIVQILNHEEEALNIFRRLNGLAIVDRCGKDYYLTSTFQSVEAHYRCRFNWWMAWLKHNHLTNPCVALLSILAHFKVVH